MKKEDVILYNMIEGSIEFQRLNEKFNRFNPLKVLKVDQFEIRHSNLIAWLLNPNENHNMGESFVKKFLSQLFNKEENIDKLEEIDLNLLDLMMSTLADLNVLREEKTKDRRFIDILAISEERKLVLLIENKFKSGESEGQLTDYLEFVRKEYEGFTVIPVFLTLYNDEPSNDEYLVLDYNDIAKILKEHIELNEEFLSTKIVSFLRYYIEVIEEELIKDEESIELASKVFREYKTAVNAICDKPKVYNKYKETIDFIINIGNNFMIEAFKGFALNNNIEESNYSNSVRVSSFILPKFLELAAVEWKPKTTWWLNNAFIIWFERLSDNRLKLNLEVGPLEYDSRLKILNALDSNGITIREYAKQPERLYTKLYTANYDIEDWSNKEEIKNAMNELYLDTTFQTVIRNIEKTIDFLNGKTIVEDNDAAKDEEIENTNISLKEAFQKFIQAENIDKEYYSDYEKKPCFILKEFKSLDESLGVPRWSWWLNNSFIIWFERLNSNKLKLTLEIGPLEYEKRLKLLLALEEEGVRIKERSKKETSCYSRILTPTCPVNNWSDTEEVFTAMKELYNSEEARKILFSIEKAIKKIVQASKKETYLSVENDENNEREL